MGGRRFEQRLREELNGARPPRAAEAERRAWHVVKAAHSEHAPVSRPHRARRLALALAGAGLLVALALTPAGARVGDWIGDVVTPAPKPTRSLLGSLPVSGRMLVDAEDGRGLCVTTAESVGWADCATPPGRPAASTSAPHAAASCWRSSPMATSAGPCRRPVVWAIRARRRTASGLHTAAGTTSTSHRGQLPRWRLARDVAATPPAWQPGRPVTRCSRSRPAGESVSWTWTCAARSESHRRPRCRSSCGGAASGWSPS